MKTLAVVLLLLLETATCNYWLTPQQIHLERKKIIVCAREYGATFKYVKDLLELRLNSSDSLETSCAVFNQALRDVHQLLVVSCRFHRLTYHQWVKTNFFPSLQRYSLTCPPRPENKPFCDVMYSSEITAAVTEDLKEASGTPPDTPDTPDMSQSRRLLISNEPPTQTAAPESVELTPEPMTAELLACNYMLVFLYSARRVFIDRCDYTPEEYRTFAVEQLVEFLEITGYVCPPTYQF